MAMLLLVFPLVVAGLDYLLLTAAVRAVLAALTRMTFSLSWAIRGLGIGTWVSGGIECG